LVPAFWTSLIVGTVINTDTVPGLALLITSPVDRIPAIVAIASSEYLIDPQGINVVAPGSVARHRPLPQIRDVGSELCGMAPKPCVFENCNWPMPVNTKRWNALALGPKIVDLVACAIALFRTLIVDVLIDTYSVPSSSIVLSILGGGIDFRYRA
jgi:hypothetical protein